jgi:hypothetical protein
MQRTRKDFSAYNAALAATEFNYTKIFLVRFVVCGLKIFAIKTQI